MKRVSLVNILLFFGIILIFLNFSWNQKFKKIIGIDRPLSFINTSNGPWSKSFGLAPGYIGIRSLQQTYDGGLIVLGSHSTHTKYSQSIESYLFKLTSSGDVEWVRSYSNILNSIVQTTDGGFLAAGDYILKLDLAGDIEWQWRSDHETFYSALQTSDGGYILGGQSHVLNIYSSCLIKFSPSREIEWKKKFGWIERWSIFSVKQTQDGGYIGASITKAQGSGEQDILVMRFNAIGEIIWQKCYGGPEDDANSDIETTGDGGYILAGKMESFMGGREVLWIIKLFKNGEIEWQKYYDGIGIEETTGSQIKQTADGGYIVAGIVETDSNDFLVLKLFPTGDIEWQRKFGSKSSDEDARLVCQADDGGFVIAGTTTDLSVGIDFNNYPASNFLIVKLTSDGDLNPCSYLETPNLFEQNTSISPVPSLFSLENLDLELSVSTATSNLRTIIAVSICDTFVQPPVDIQLIEGINRSLFRKELLITLTWNQNSYNEGYNINKYRIYRKSQDDNQGSYLRIKEIPSNNFKFVDQISDITKKYLYVFTSVDSNGNESPRSIPVGN